MPRRAHILSLILKHLRSRATFDEKGIARYRTMMSQNAKLFRLPKDVSMSRFSIDSIPAAWITPDDRKIKRCIIYTHGGGYISGSIQSHTNLAARLSKAADAGILLYEYRLAPEHPFPAGVNDVKTVYHWVLNRIQDPRAIALVGDSAGGGLNLSLLSGLLQKKLPLPGCSIFFSPWIDLRCTNPSHEQLRNLDPLLDPDHLKIVARLYTDMPLSDPRISPVLNDFTGLTPVLIQVGENEVLLDDSKELDRKLKNAGVLSSLEIWKEMFHVWHLFSRFIPEAVKALEVTGNFIREHTTDSEAVDLRDLPDMPQLF